MPIGIVSQFTRHTISVDICHPRVSVAETKNENGITPIQKLNNRCYEGVIIAVAHTLLKALGAEKMPDFGKSVFVLYDLKCLLPIEAADLRL